jgi:lipoprotein-anchoring transpeptidase ErfK/SrfK
MPKVINPKVRKIASSPLFLIFSIAILIPAIILSANTLFRPKNDGEYDPSKKTASFHGEKFQVPEEITRSYLSYADDFIDLEDLESTDVLGSKSKKEKRIEVDLTEQKLHAYEGNKRKMSFDVSTGKWGLTPTGEFQIWIKLKYTLMTGGSKDIGTYYYLPNVPFTMYFYQGYGIHGTYWHNNFGHPMSHGCINMRTEDAERLFYWANPVLSEGANNILSTPDNPGTKVIIYGVTPNE